MKRSLSKKNWVIIALPVLVIVLAFAFRSHNDPNANLPVAHADWNKVYLDMDELVSTSDLIIVGKIKKSEPIVRPSGRVMTLQYVNVDTVIKGDVSKKDEIVLAQTGGRVGNTVSPYVEDAPLFAKNEDVYLMLTKIDSENFYVVNGGYQGAGKIQKGKLRMNVPNDNVCKLIDTITTEEIYPTIIVHMKNENEKKKLKNN